MMMKVLKSTKWELLFYFLLTGVLTAGILYAGNSTDYIVVSDPRVWIYYVAGIVVFTVVIGYIAGQRIQRRLDLLHLSMLQVAKGNLSVRIPETTDMTFAGIYGEFNRMTDAVEKKMHLLQVLGEQEVTNKEQAAEKAVLEERRRLARDLHDTVSQQLFAVHMAASSLPKILENRPEQGGKVMDQLIQMSNTAQKQMRALIAQLRPMELVDKSLSQALDQWFPDYCRQNGLKGIIDLDLKGQLSEAIEHQLFLIIQEAMANIVKHSGAKLVSLALQESKRQVVLSVSDDGQGFSSSVQKQGSYGLSTMRERAEKLGGTAEIISKPGAGTTVRIHIPKFEDVRKGEES
ncbi:sensor histidine kinase LiaS [Paenibacillus physcomitrellae]|uniref:Oxygen sensor histidine kinase NreB n=2 Tax=Paenibacillus physcomitrellae TaxID=1619311 RepID=A0ABQ1G7R9_9BACL|nr:sensor histidine kinase LiaS [Paenibacillus physcomitrellae]